MQKRLRSSTLKRAIFSVWVRLVSFRTMFQCCCFFPSIEHMRCVTHSFHSPIWKKNCPYVLQHFHYARGLQHENEKFMMNIIIRIHARKCSLAVLATTKLCEKPKIHNKEKVVERKCARWWPGDCSGEWHRWRVRR